jgi:hypothetical protein
MSTVKKQFIWDIPKKLRQPIVTEGENVAIGRSHRIDIKRGVLAIKIPIDFPNYPKAYVATDKRPIRDCKFLFAAKKLLYKTEGICVQGDTIFLIAVNKQRYITNLKVNSHM